MRMKSILAVMITVMALISTAFAQPDPTETRTIGRFGHVGLWNTLSAHTLGQSRLAFNIYANHSLDRDFVRNVWRWQPVGSPGHGAPEGTPGIPASILIRDSEWEWIDRRPTLTTFNLSVAYGITRFLDLGVMLPIHIDNIGDGFRFPNIGDPGDPLEWPSRSNNPANPERWVGDGHWTQAGVGDLEISMKFRYPPNTQNNFFTMAYYGAIALPTGSAHTGWFPRSTHFLDNRMNAAFMYGGTGSSIDPVLRSVVGAYNNFTSGSPEIDMKMLWTWDFRELADNFPVLFHVNYGLRWVTQHRNDHVFYLNSALEVRPTNWLSLFTEFSAAPRFGSIAQEESFAVWNRENVGVVDTISQLAPRYHHFIKRGLLDDPMRISPGFFITAPNGLTFSAGFDISLANNYGVFIGDRQTSQSARTRQSDEFGNSVLTNNNAPISSILMETGVEPRLRFAASIGWNGLTMPHLPVITPPIEAPRAIDTVRIIETDTVFLERLVIDTITVEVERPAVAPVTYTITASVLTGQGTISPAGVNTLVRGSLATFNITPAQGFSIGSVVVDGADMGAIPQFTFPSVTQNHTISVVFTQDPIIEVVEIPAPAPIAFEIPREGLVLRGVNFAVGSTVLPPEAFPALDAVIASLREWPEIRVEIQGHTSAIGARTSRRIENNRRLSQERAYAVMRYFIQQGIPADRLRAVGMGEEFPIASNETRAGQALNQRVTLVPIEEN